MLGTDFTKGSPSWLDLGTPDTAAAAGFYTGVFGWDFESAGPDAGGYGFFKQDGKTVAALGPLTEEGASSAWTLYFQSPDVDATAKAAEQNGGTVRAEPFDVMDAGRMAQLTDPGGAEFAVWQPASTKGLERTSEDNTLCWAELHVADPRVALDFYGKLFGWRSQEMEAPGMTYRVLSTAEGDQQDASFGGIAELQDGGEEARWVPYFGVADADEIVARTQGNGGSVLMPAADVPDVGRIAWLADPFGATFAVLKPAPQM
ncbi:VOC family protein [Streptomyces sp. ISL-36]|uniref:VOC family protein n=1 Tax=Streptomyces sp. ISL-36 TaxID=2819182 RepID=UPI001BE5792B|nr:VOC family protein [Streptomyces sp. ISL-36]MBT2439512.1 VOC family protein [Streptomyces sp. ISL-36]